MDDQWKSLLESFLRNECTEKENAIVYYALRDDLIDEEFREAVDSILNNQNIVANEDLNEPVSEDILRNVLADIKEQDTKSNRHRLIIPEWLKIVATVLITLSVTWLAFHIKTSKEPEPAAMNVIHVPAGQIVNLTLADGTNIWLNARTILKYPSMFTGNKREVILEGEGFFDVTHNGKTPFIVHTDEYDIQVYGTQFNVEAYSGSREFTTSLLAGSVRVTSTTDTTQAITLQPNTMARVQKGKLISNAITDFNHYRWREGLICFKDMPFVNLMVLFEKCYGLKIIVENRQIKNYAPTGKFRQSDGIDYALRVLQRDFKFKFERDDEKHIMYIK
jgi:ferric-dicitrate binding protein FerR (iron transport regulator)